MARRDTLLGLFPLVVLVACQSTTTTGGTTTSESVAGSSAGGASASGTGTAGTTTSIAGSTGGATSASSGGSTGGTGDGQVRGMTETVFAAGDPAQYCAFGDGGEFAPSTLVLASGGLYVLAGDIDLLTFDAGVTTLLSQSDFFAHEIALGRDGQLFAATSDTNQDGWQIVKIIGSGFVSYVGDTSAGTCLASAETDGGATLYGVTSLIGDDAGYLYIGETADLTHSCSYIRRVDPTGHVLPLAGDGANSLNDGSGPEAEFFGPSGLALDAQGNLYVADSDNDLIRKVAPSGFTSTLAGTQDPGFQDGPGGPDGTATFNDPGPLTVDAAGNIYVADIGNLAIRRVAPDGTTTTLAGNGQSGSTDGTLGRDGTTTFRSVSGIAVDAAGKTIYVADQGSCAIRVIHLDN